MTDHATVFDTLKNLAKPEADFVAMEPNRGNALIQLFRKTRAKFDTSYSAAQMYFLSSELKELAVSNGLVDITVVPQGYFSPPMAQIIIPPQLLTVPLSSLLVAIDSLIDKGESSFFAKLSWNLIIRAKFPK
jgi:hypothetical protein